MKIKLPANLGPVGNISLFPSYVSNGHWAIARTRLSNAAMVQDSATAEAFFPKRYTVREVAEDKAIEQINSSIANPQAWTATRHLLDYGREGLHRLFVKEETGELALFYCGHLKLLELDSIDAVLWGTTGQAAFRDSVNAEDMTVLIMPRKFDVAELSALRRG